MASGWHVQTLQIRRLEEELGHAQRCPHVPQGIMPGEG